ncbi:MAG: hypothetical protein AB8C13_01855 [Phycisphaerales bacterium]
MILPALQSTLCSIAPLTGTVTATTPDRDASMKEGMSLLMMFSILAILAVMMLAIVVVQRSNRRLKSKQDHTPTDLTVDPWVESGRRIDSSITEFDEDL